MQDILSFIEHVFLTAEDITSSLGAVFTESSQPESLLNNGVTNIQLVNNLPDLSLEDYTTDVLPTIMRKLNDRAYMRGVEAEAILISKLSVLPPDREVVLPFI